MWFFFFKQKTAYEMLSSDWSSDVCSSDLTTVIGPYEAPKVRLPGAGGASEIAGSCREVFIVARHNARSFVEKIGFVTSFGHGAGGSNRQDIGLRTKGPTLIVTDLCVMVTEIATNELDIKALHPGNTRHQRLKKTKPTRS